MLPSFHRSCLVPLLAIALAGNAGAADDPAPAPPDCNGDLSYLAPLFPELRGEPFDDMRKTLLAARVEQLIGPLRASSAEQQSQAYSGINHQLDRINIARHGLALNVAVGWASTGPLALVGDSRSPEQHRGASLASRVAKEFRQVSPDLAGLRQALASAQVKPDACVGTDAGSSLPCGFATLAIYEFTLQVMGAASAKCLAQAPRRLPAAGDESDVWRVLSHNPQPSAVQSFLASYPDGRYAAEARQLLK